jgi:ABC-2 type transport system permease protein
MRAFFAIIIKDLRVRFSSPMELVFFILLPVVFTLVLAGSSMGGSGNAKVVPLVLLQDQVGTAQSKAFGAHLRSMPGIKVQEVSDPTALIGSADPDMLINLSAANNTGAGLPFIVTFKLSPWRGSPGVTARQVADWLQSGVAPGPDAAAPGTQGVGASAKATSARTPSAGAPGGTISAPSAAETGNAGQIITWVLVPLLGLGAGFITERRRGTMRRIHSTPAPRGVVTAASVTAEVLGALVQIGLLISFGTVVFHLPWFSHPLLLVGLSIAFCVAGASLGALLGALCRTSRQAGSLGLALSMVLAVFGGCWYPAANFPASLRSVTGMDPAGWAMNGFLAVLSPSAGTGPALRSAALLLVFGVAVFFLAAAASRARRASLAA